MANQNIALQENNKELEEILLKQQQELEKARHVRDEALRSATAAPAPAPARPSLILMFRLGGVSWEAGFMHDSTMAARRELPDL